MKVFIVRSNSANPDPRIEKTIAALLKGGHSVKFIGWNRLSDLNSDSIQIENVKIESVLFKKEGKFGAGLKNIFNLIRFQFYIARKLIENRKEFDVVHAADFDTALISGFIAKILKKKFVYDIYDYYADAFPVPKIIKPMIIKLDTKLINYSDVTVLTSESRLKQLRSARPKKIVYIHNSPSKIPCLNITEINSDKKNHFILAYVGVLQPGRLILETIEIVLKTENWIIEIAGFGPLENEISKIANDNKKIKYYGRVNYKKSLLISKNADLLFATYDPKIPNHKFSTPNKIYEAMALGKPIVVCNDTGVDEVVRNNKIGICINYDINEMSEAISKVEKNIDVYRTMGNKAKSIYSELYSWGIMEKRIIEMYRNL